MMERSQGHIQGWVGGRDPRGTSRGGWEGEIPEARPGVGCRGSPAGVGSLALSEDVRTREKRAKIFLQSQASLVSESSCRSAPGSVHWVHPWICPPDQPLDLSTRSAPGSIHQISPWICPMNLSTGSVHWISPWISRLFVTWVLHCLLCLSMSVKRTA